MFPSLAEGISRRKSHQYSKGFNSCRAQLAMMEIGGKGVPAREGDRSPGFDTILKVINALGL